MNSGVLLDKYIFLVRIDFRVTFQIQKKTKQKNGNNTHTEAKKNKRTESSN
jgi:hypothetical protein